MVHAEAIAAGAYPNPDIDGDQPGWMMKRVDSVWTPVVQDRASSTVVKEDIRSKRKFIGQQADLILIWDALVLTASVNIDGLVRMYFLKP